jgi:type II secretory pathway pseudopilin PulG
MPHNPHITASVSPRPPDNCHIGAVSARGSAELDDLLEIVVNRRLKKTWRVEVNFKTGERVLTIPEVLADPPPSVRECLIRWAMQPMTRKARRNSAFVNNKRALEETIRAYMESHGVQRERKSRVDPAIFEHQTKGFTYNLQDIFDTLNRGYFQGTIKSYIRWGHCASKTSYQTTRVDKDGNPFHLITISGVYDSPQVPQYAIYGLVYHEMLHIAIPPRSVNGRRVIHGRDFKAAERKFPFYDQWIEWEKENMGRLIQNARRRALRKHQLHRPSTARQP